MTDASYPRAATPALLVVDDEETVCFGMRAYFAAQGFHVDTRTSLAGALESLDARRYDAVVSDLRLSGSDGAEGLKLLRHVRDRSHTLPFVLLSGFRTDAVTAEAERHRVSAFLDKPSPLAHVARVLARLMAGAAA